ncbi:hypothetical protein BY996DRAFT_8688238 [Phakopsora pachyrhizi]|nr:hypothetical protein BY996DRAFT_8688238 [Phakopsora pachyrhizi]
MLRVRIRLDGPPNATIQGLGYALSTEEQILKWIEERRGHWPTAKLIKQKAELAKALKERQQQERKIKRVLKENVLGKLLVAGFCLGNEERFFALNNSRPAPSTDAVAVESQSRGDLKVDHQPYWFGVPLDAVDKSLTRKLSRVEGVN